MYVDTTPEILRKTFPVTIKCEYPVVDRHGERPGCFWLLEDLVVTLGCGLTITIPKGFVTDFASVPKFLWGVFPPIGDHNLADTVHDYLYTMNMLPREYCDDEFLLFMKALRPKKKSWLDNYMRYYAVRFFGKRAYKNSGVLKR